VASSPIARHEERRISTEQPQPTAAHRTITTARCPDYIRLSALVPRRYTQFTAHPSCELGRGPPKRDHFPAILAVFFPICSQLRAWLIHDKIKTKLIKEMDHCRDSPAGKMEKRFMSEINKLN